MNTTDQINGLSDHHDPDHPSGRGRPAHLWAADVTVVNPDGTVDVQPVNSRASKVGVSVAAGLTLAVGDRVVVVDLSGDPRLPFVLQAIKTSAAAAVTSFNSRTGAVTPQAGDYTAVMVGAIAVGAAAGGDLSGTLPSPTVAQIQGRPVSSGVPGSGQGLVWNGTSWSPVTVLQAANNLSDVASAATARTNLGLATGATAAIDTTAADFQMDGTALAGATGKVADAGHRHPTDTSRLAATATVGGDLSGAMPNPTVATIGGSTGPLHVAGDLIPSAASSRVGCLLCDGSPVSRTTFSALFTAIGTTYGVGDGSTTFNVPDLRGRGPIGAGTGGGLTARTLGGTGGEEAHLLSIAEMPSHNHGGTTGTGTSGTGTSGGMSANDPHTHTVSDTGGFAGGIGQFTPTGSGTGYYQRSGALASVQADSKSIAHTHTIPGLSIPALTIASQGGGGTHNTMQPFLVVNWFIKT